MSDESLIAMVRSVVTPSLEKLVSRYGGKLPIYYISSRGKKRWGAEMLTDNCSM
jgi:hypothetical protein